MKTSESITKIAPALLAAKKAFKPALKTAENPAYKGSRYVDLQTVVEATEGALSDNGLMLIQTPGTSEIPTMASLTSRLIHVSGEWIEDTLTIPAGTQNRYDAQTVGSAITYARRYSYMGILGIAPEDDDGSTAAGSHVVQSSRPNGSYSTSSPTYQRPPVTPIREDAGDAEEPMFDPETGDMVEAKSTIQHREQKQAVPDLAFTPASGKTVNPAQGKRFVAIALGNGRDWKQIGVIFKQMGIEKADQIPYNQYDNAIEWAGGKNERRA